MRGVRGVRFDHRYNARFLEEPGKIAERIGPRVALVLDPAVEYAERGLAAVCFYQRDVTQERRRALEADPFGEESADLDLGMDAGRDLTIEFDDRRTFDNRRTVRLLDTANADNRLFRPWPAGKRLAWPEDQPPLRGLDRACVAYGGDGGGDEGLVVQGIGQITLARATTKLGQCKGGCRHRRRLPFVHQRQRIARCKVAATRLSNAP